MIYTSTSSRGKKSAKKWRSSEEKKRAESLEKSWNELTTKWGTSGKSTKKTEVVKLPTDPGLHIRKSGDRPASLSSWNVGPVSSKSNQYYTGTAIVGIGVLHKSCLQPIFSNQEAEDIAKMRR